jgi:hypothetical protein
MVERFLQRLAIYIQIAPTPAMTNFTVGILAELLSTLGLLTKRVRQNRSLPGSIRHRLLHDARLITAQRNSQRNF